MVRLEREDEVNVELRQARQASGKTQEQVANEIRVSTLSYQRYEYGIREPSVRTAIRIADVLGVKSYQDFKEIFS